jgi:hypothetical protein
MHLSYFSSSCSRLHYFFSDHTSTEDKVCLVLKIVDKASSTLDTYIFPIPSSSLFLSICNHVFYMRIKHIVSASNSIPNPHCEEICN